MAANETQTKAFVTSRTFDAPREAVWKAWTDRDALTQWWGPKGCPIEVQAFDAKPGGIFHYSMALPNGDKWWGRFVYRDVEAPSRLVFVNSFSNEEGGIVRAPFSAHWPMEVLNNVTFTENVGKTTVKLEGGPLNPTDEERVAFEGMTASMQQGFGGTFDQLETYLAAQ